MLSNQQIADNFNLAAKLIEIHGGNTFKSKSYSSASFTIEKLSVELATISPKDIFFIKGIGESIGKSITEMLAHGTWSVLDELIKQTPKGIFDMMLIKGIGPKKINVIWHQLQIESLGELLYACYENRLMMYKGFGEKTQENIKQSIEYYLGNIGKYLYAEIIEFAEKLVETCQQHVPNKKWQLVGDVSRQEPIIEQVEIITTATKAELIETLNKLNQVGHVNESIENDILTVKWDAIQVVFYISNQQNWISKLVKYTSTAQFYDTHFKTYQIENQIFEEESHIFELAHLPYLPIFLRHENTDITQENYTSIIQPTDVKGIIHCHSNWSDGAQSIEDMVKACIAKGFEYMVLSDHSKSAFYANGLQPERVLAQHQLIDELNATYAPFTIFKSIESDILQDGQLDYDEDILSTFDLVIASIHANLKMTEEKAMQRLLHAVSNKFTSILGHPTGRLLLSRSGYPVNHQQLIASCAKHNVVIELNAHPRRLDIDWTWLKTMKQQGVLTSINPDAHHTDGYNDIKYGVLVAQKAGITAKDNLSSMSLEQMKAFVYQQKQKRLTVS